MKYLFLSFCFFVAACSTVPTELSRSPAGEPPANVVEAREILTDQQFDQMAPGADGLVKSGGAMKFVIDLRDKAGAKVHFINGRYREPRVPLSQKFHYYFVRANIKPQFGAGRPEFQVQEEFNRTTYDAKTLKERNFIVGTIQRYNVKISGKDRSFYGVQFYPQDTIHDDMISFTVNELQKHFVIPGAQMAFVALGEQQTVKADLKIPTYKIGDLIAGQKFIIMNGVSKGVLGILQVKPKNIDALSPIDIPVFDRLPLDLSVVAGVITYDVQDSGSHINLKSKERNSPDVVVRDPALRTQLEKLNGKPVLFIASNDPREPNPYRIETQISLNGRMVPVTAKMVEEAYREKIKNRPAIHLKVKNADDVRFYDDMCPDATDCLDNFTYGGKATKLGFLAHREVLGAENPWLKRQGYNYRVPPLGFGVPLSFYLQFLAANPSLDLMIKKFVAEDQANIPVTQLEQQNRMIVRTKKLAEIRNAFYKAKIPADMIQKLKVAMAKLRDDIHRVYGQDIELKKVKVRSSANVEDIPEFDGAGLHDSFAASVKNDDTWIDSTCVLDEPEADEEDVDTKLSMKPKSFTCGLKGVYASLWNKRAVEERNFKNIVNTEAAMGLAIVPEYNLLKSMGLAKGANSVIVTRVVNSTAIYGYTMSTQIGDSLVTNPTPHTQSEVAVATFQDPGQDVAFSYIQYAKPKKNDPVRTDPLFGRDFMTKIVHLVQHVELAYCETKKRAHYEHPERGVELYNTNPDAGGDCQFTLADVDKTKALDIEFKYLGDEKSGRVLCKQVREFSGH